MSYSIEIKKKNVDGGSSDDINNHYFVNSNGVSFTIYIQAVKEKPLINIWDVKYNVVPVGCGADPHHLSVEIIIKNNSGLSLVICFHDISKNENDKIIENTAEFLNFENMQLQNDFAISNFLTNNYYKNNDDNTLTNDQYYKNAVNYEFCN